MFGKGKIKESPAGDDPWLDGGCVQRVKVAQQKLRRVLEAVSCNSRFLEYVTFDIAGHGLCISAWLFRLTAVVEVIRPETCESHVRPPSVVPAFEFRTQGCEMVESVDQRDTW